MGHFTASSSKFQGFLLRTTSQDRRQFSSLPSGSIVGYFGRLTSRNQIRDTFAPRCLLSSDVCTVKGNEDAESAKRTLLHLIVQGVENKSLKQITESFNRLRNVDPQWPNLLNQQQRIPAGVLHLFNQHGLNEEIDRFHWDLKQAQFQIGQGILSTLILHYCNIKSWDKACSTLKTLKDQGLLKHTRMYSPLISGLLKDNHYEKALELFDELLVIEKTIPTYKYNSVDINMVCSLIECASQLNRHTETQSLASNMKQSAFGYLRDAGIALSPELSNAVQKWFLSAQNKDWTINSLSRGMSLGLCSICKTQLELTGQPSSFYDHTLFETVVNHFDSYKLKEETRNDCLRLKRILKSYGPFHFVIDGSNIASSVRNRSNKNPVFNENVLKECVAHVKGLVPNANLLLILVRPINGKMRNIYSNLFHSLQLKYDNLSYFVCNSVNDDLSVLYSSIVSELKIQESKLDLNRSDNVCIVTNDLMRNHRFLFADKRQWELLRWIRHRLVQVKDESDIYGINNGLRLIHRLVDPVTQWNENNGLQCFHFPLKNGTWICANDISKD